MKWRPRRRCRIQAARLVGGGRRVAEAKAGVASRAGMRVMAARRWSDRWRPVPPPESGHNGVEAEVHSVTDQVKLTNG